LVISPGHSAESQSPLPWSTSIAAGPQGTLPRGKKNRHGTSRQVNVHLGQSLWNSQDPFLCRLLMPSYDPLRQKGQTLSSQPFKQSGWLLSPGWLCSGLA
jgi:hypothetical protein